MWTGHEMIVSTAEIYTPEDRERFREYVEQGAFKDPSESFKHSLLNNPGRFKDFGQSFYFDDPKVFWAELPKPPEGK